MKAGALAAIALGVLLLGISAFYGIYSVKNAGSAERLSRSLPKDAAFVVRLVEAKAARQRNLSIGAGIPAVLLLGAGIFMMKKARPA
jgi:hypothetical protein